MNERELRNKLVMAGFKVGAGVGEAFKDALHALEAKWAFGTFGGVDEIGKFWVVTKPSEVSHLQDIFWASSIFEFVHALKAGLKSEEVVGLFKDENQAKKTAQELLSATTAAAEIVIATYKIESLTKEEYETLLWLSDRGYDAGILELISGGQTEDGGYTFEPIPEHVAWQINDNIAEDEGAFLTSNGSRSLEEKLFAFLEKII